MALAIKRLGLHNLPPHLSYVSTAPDITQKLKGYVVFLSMSGSENSRIWWVWSGSEKNQLCG